MKVFLLNLLLIFLAGCDPSFRLYLANESTSVKEVKVGVEKFYVQGVDTLKFFPSTSKPSRKIHDAAKVSRPVRKDTINDFYSFTINPNEETLLRPFTIATPIKYVIVDNDTIFFYNPNENRNFKRFQRIGLFKYATKITDK